MKRLLVFVLCALLLAGCAAPAAPDASDTEPETVPSLPDDDASVPTFFPAEDETPFVSRFDGETVIVLADSGITVNGGGETDEVFTSRDIVYYEDRSFYESGNPYGEGTAADRHSAEEAAAHTVVNITAPGTYRVTGQLSAGQIRVDLGKKADEDPEAVVELILQDADITCTVAPAILFLNVYECDGDRSKKNATPDVDTTAAGANLILEGENSVSGSHVAKIFKDNDGEKKLWKQDGAIYSYMSLNIYGPGALNLTADNEGIGTEMHVSLWGGSIAIRSGNDGINANEDDVSVAAIHGGNLRIAAGLGTEGDGIDSNGYLVIRGGTVIALAHPASDSGLDSVLGSFLHGGTVIALGSAEDWAAEGSGQVTMNLQFARQSSGGLSVTQPDGTVIFAFDPAADSFFGSLNRQYQGAILSCGEFALGERYQLCQDGQPMTCSGNDGILFCLQDTVNAFSGLTEAK